ncbi:uncharacterized protein LOC130741249 [Lotus japonicus]|uniref:uncharacterized protein LOC130741249 n=1 Tax=Lotus japonicus TaxID=34305 RepID=UPI0025884864|nr:uncharacterized protein LOC130741249 [Lotus japonicus]
MRKSDGKIVFAQGEEDFADFVFSFLTFPLGGVVRKFRGYSSLGSIDGLYKSMNDLNGCKYFTSDDIKNRLVDPFIASQFKLSKQILPIKEPPLLQYYYHNVYDDLITASSENQALNRDRCHLVDPKSSTGSNGGGYVKGPAVFMATDDLVVLPMTPSSALSLLDSLQTPPTELKEKIVTIGFNEGCSILKAALTSKSALTNGLRHLITQVKEEKCAYTLLGVC